MFHDAGGVFHHAGTEARVPGPDPERHSYGSFLSFSDPDGNGWVLQEVTTRLPGRIDAAATAFASADDLAGALRRAAAAHGEHETRIGQRGRGLAGLVRGVHGARAGRDRAAVAERRPSPPRRHRMIDHDGRGVDRFRRARDRREQRDRCGDRAAAGAGGAAVGLVARRRQRLDELADDIAAAGGTALVIEADITDPDRAAEAVQVTLDRFDRLDVLVNNAGIMLLGTALHARSRTGIG